MSQCRQYELTNLKMLHHIKLKKKKMIIINLKFNTKSRRTYFFLNKKKIVVELKCCHVNCNVAKTSEALKTVLIQFSIESIFYKIPTIYLIYM